MTTLKDSVRRIADRLTGLYDRREAEAIARTVVADRAGVSLSHLLVHGNDECRIDGLEALTDELAAGRPVQYVLGHCEFCGSEFAVGEGVLIPRPETEELVAAVAERAAAGASVLDLCTGSGCIAVAIAKRIDDCRTTAVDISPRAIEYARRNAAANGVAVDIRQADVLGDLPFGDGEFDIVVANPPYVPLADREGMHINVTGYEPHEALFVDDDRPLLFYEAIARHARRLLRDGGSLCFEVYELYADRTAAMLRESGFRDVTVIEDANLKPRIVCSRK